MIGYARLLAFDGTPSKMMQFMKVGAAVLSPVSKENEIAAWNILSEVARAKYSAFPDDPETDANVLSKDADEGPLIPSKLKHILRYRLGEKVALLYLKDCGEKVRGLLCQPSVKQAKKLMKTWRDHPSYAS